MRVDIFSSDALKRLKGACFIPLLLLYRPTATQRWVFMISSAFSLSYIASKLILACFILTDKAGGKKFSRDFEEGSAQLQEFVKFFDKESKRGPPIMEALSNADIFYEMQYKEVKIVANVSHSVFIVTYLLC